MARLCTGKKAKTVAADLKVWMDAIASVAVAPEALIDVDCVPVALRFFEPLVAVQFAGSVSESASVYPPFHVCVSGPAVVVNV